MELYNSTLYNYQAIINGVSYDLKSRSSIFFDYGNEWKDELTASKRHTARLYLHLFEKINFLKEGGVMCYPVLIKAICTLLLCVICLIFIF